MYVMGIHQNHLSEEILMGTHKINFCLEDKKLSQIIISLPNMEICLLSKETLQLHVYESMELNQR